MQQTVYSKFPGGEEICTWMVVQVDNMDNGVPSGSIHTCHTREPLSFCGLTELVLKTDAYCEALGFPEAEFSQAGPGSACSGAIRTEVPAVHELKDFKDCQGKAATFLMEVRHRQRASFQGVLRWTNPHREKNFRSALELQRYVNELLGQTRKMKESRTWNK